MIRTLHQTIGDRVPWLGMVLLSFLVTGCSSQIKIMQISGEPRPRLRALQDHIDATVGVILREEVSPGKTKRPWGSNAGEIGAALANRLRNLKAFKTVYYPITDVEPDTTIEVEARYFVDPHLSAARATGFVVGLTLYTTAPLAQVRVTIDEEARMTMTGVARARDVRCSYEAKFNPFGNVNAYQAGAVMGQNAVQHVADVLALEVIRAHRPGYDATTDPGDTGQ